MRKLIVLLLIVVVFSPNVFARPMKEPYNAYYNKIAKEITRAYQINKFIFNNILNIGAIISRVFFEKNGGEEKREKFIEATLFKWKEPPPDDMAVYSSGFNNPLLQQNRLLGYRSYKELIDMGYNKKKTLNHILKHTKDIKTLIRPYKRLIVELKLNMNTNVHNVNLPTYTDIYAGVTNKFNTQTSLNLGHEYMMLEDFKEGRYFEKNINPIITYAKRWVKKKKQDIPFIIHIFPRFYGYINSYDLKRIANGKMTSKEAIKVLKTALFDYNMIYLTKYIFKNK